MGSWVAAGHQKDQVLVKGWNFQPLSSFSRTGRGAGKGASNLACPPDAASTKIALVWHSGTFPVGEHIHHEEADVP